MSPKMEKLLLPALKGLMGDWSYYVTVMKLKDVAERVKPVAEIHKTAALSELIQRQLQQVHAKNITEYLIKQPQRLFNALVVGVYGGSPEWYELSIKSSVLDKDSAAFDGVLGFLKLSGSEDLFAIDGQHRVAGIQQALQEESKLGDEEVSVLFVAHKNDEAGLERTRRLFTVLNRHAKIVGKMELIALDDDDPVAVTTRRLADEYPLFADKLSITNTKSMSAKDKSNVTSIIALYDSLDVYHRTGSKAEWAKRKKRGCSEAELKDFYKRSTELFTCIEKHFPDVKKAASANASMERFRNPEGGNLIFRPVGFQLLIQAIKILMEQEFSLNSAVTKLSVMPWTLNASPWSKLLWNPSGKRMITTPENQKLALALLVLGAGGDLSLSSVKIDEDRLESELTEVYGFSVSLKKLIAKR
ncbi:MAG: DNA sulfur modification protein DndB [Candidatus Melainabacteria bacterium]|nr:DNA sulfur modification protein DndB [Candidatus Melainabacteria bacterium]